jgi:maltokinase
VSSDITGLTAMLTSWLPAQRWCQAGHQLAGEPVVAVDVLLAAGDPEFRHLTIDVSAAAGSARYQLPVGLASEVPDVPDRAVIGKLPDGLVAYDALHDPRMHTVLLSAIADQRNVGPLTFARQPGAGLADWRPSRVVTAEQSNTSVIFGDAAILKVFRRLFPGTNPDLEVTSALSALGSHQVAAPLGLIETEFDGQPVLLAALSEFLAGATDGWQLATGQLHQLYAGHTAPAPDFAEEAGLLGQATARLHQDMATAFGSRALTVAELGALAARLTTELDHAVGIVPELQPHAAVIRSAYAALARLPEPVPVQRSHGDYHLGQVLRAHDGWVALDFEGEPLVPLDQRRAFAPALRDVAGMLRSFDYAARHQLVDRPDSDAVRDLAADWTQRCQRAFCAGYAEAGGADPAVHAVLLNALMLEKAVYEVIYEYRHRPSWLPIPLDAIAAA